MAVPSFPDRTKEAQAALIYDNEQAAIQKAAVAAQEAAQAAEAAKMVVATPAPVYASYTAPVQGNCSSWMAQAGITDPANAIYLINIESGCNPNAVNRSSGACGIGQQLPCGKWPHVWNDPIGGLIDMQNYVFGSYGSWANAAAHERNYNWY